MLDLNTKRRRILQERLRLLGSWAGACLLPVDTLEILGHGSFFRGKPRPKDVDILVRHTRENTPAFDRFLSLLDRIGEDVAFQEQFKVPQTALLHVFDKEQSARAAESNDRVTQQRSMFEMWIKGFSWNMLLPQTIVGQLLQETPEYYAKKLIKRHFPNVNADFFLGPSDAPTATGLKSSFTVLIWSKSHPDVQENLGHAMTPERVRDRVAGELANFDQQSFYLTAQIDYFAILTEKLLATPRNGDPQLSRRDWFSSWANSQTNGVLAEDVYERHLCDEILLNDDEIEKILGRKYRAACREALSLEELDDACETRREEIKKQWQLVEARRKIIRALIAYNSGSVTTELSAKQYVGFGVLQQAYAHEKKHLTAILNQLGYPCHSAIESAFGVRPLSGDDD